MHMNKLEAPLKVPQPSVLNAEFYLETYSLDLEPGYTSRVTGYGLEGWDSIPGRNNNFPLRHHIHTGPEVGYDVRVIVTLQLSQSVRPSVWASSPLF
jgi:hypothetical protein